MYGQASILQGIINKLFLPCVVASVVLMLPA